MKACYIAAFKNQEQDFSTWHGNYLCQILMQSISLEDLK